MALATVVAIVVYRMAVLFSLRVYADQVDNSQAILFTTCTAACINLFCIMIFNWVSFGKFVKEECFNLMQIIRLVKSRIFNRM